MTNGRPVLTDAVPAEGMNEEELLRLAAAAETGSEHPLGEAIVSGAEKRGLPSRKSPGSKPGSVPEYTPRLTAERFLPDQDG
ncbi:hypothetical protein QNN00_07865 [Bacillus velezensis]|nr:hypothetical protein [Bacillus velezensis]